MPIEECQEDNKPGYRYGENGKCYTYTAGDEESRNAAKQQAYLQGAAISHQTGEEMKASTDIALEGEPGGALEGDDLSRALEVAIEAENEVSTMLQDDANRVTHPQIKSTLQGLADAALGNVGELEALLDYIGEGHFEVVEVEVEEKRVYKSIYSKIRKVDNYRHWITGVVLEPDTIDLQGDVITEDDVRLAMEGYMLNSQLVGHQHQEVAKASVVECYLAPENFDVEGLDSVRKGSWVLTVKVFDDDLWNDVLDGKLTGFSIGGTGLRTEP